MKKTLLNFIALTLLGVSTKVSAQSSCSINDVVVQNVNVIPGSGTTCLATFDVSFTLGSTANSNYIFIQTYIESATRNGQNIPGPNFNRFPNHFNCRDGEARRTTPPRGKDVGEPLLNLAINNTGAAPAFTNYVLDPTIATLGNVATSTIERVSLPGGRTRFTLTGVQVALPYACDPTIDYVFATNVFTTTTPDATNVNCVSCAFPVPLPFIDIAGVTNCNTVTADVTNLSNRVEQIDYALYSDVDQDGELLPVASGGADVLITTGKVTVPRGQTKPIATTTISSEFVGEDVFVALTIDGASLVELLPTIACAAPLPVSLKSFNAKRENTQVKLTWETVSENNNRGFSVQRNTGGGWKDVAFVGSKSTDGNSNTLLTYDFNESNTEKAVTHYRLLQMDYDGKSKLSEIRSVKGLSQASRNMIYPNPSNEGGVNVIFNDERGNRDVLISDMSGRIVKQYRNVSTSNLRVDLLSPGMYSVRIINQASGTQTNEKIVINR